MKQRFNALDLKASLFELSRSFIGLRVANVYDIDHKTYLIKFTKPDDKAVILIESGIRIHSTLYDWPKNVIPSGFSMKMRKHLRSRRLEKICQLGIDRIVDMQFGSGEAAYHLIVELYDKGNILLTDYEYIILSVLRPRTDTDADVRFAVKEKYPLQTAKYGEKLTKERLKEILANAKDNDDLKKFLTSNLMFGTVVIDHCLQIAGYPDKCVIGKQFNKENDSELDKLFNALLKAEEIFDQADKTPSKGYVIQKKTKTAKIETATNQTDIGQEEVLTYEEFHPFLFKKHELSALYVEYESFDKAVDEFFSKLESQKLELKVLQQNKEAIKKLENVKKDHEKRIEDLQKSQQKVENSAKLIENSLELVDKAIFLVNNAVANQLDWSEINEIIDEAKEQNHPVASVIKELKLDINHIVVLLRNTENEEDPDELIPVQIDLGLTAYKNAKKFYDQKKQSVAKEQKTIDAGDKALKSAEKKTLETLKQVKKNVAITKSRKLFWFEKFYWFISSENYLIIGGRDQQQNEIIVKRHLKPGDVYVHADLHGASSIIIKNPTGAPVPPKTLNEAGCMAVCYSVAWEAKVIANAYWVYHDQVSKQAPSGEYLTTGSFMIRGKKNFLPQTSMIFGFSLLYKLEESSVARHENERKVKTFEDEQSVIDENEEVEDAATNAEIDNMLKELEKTGDLEEEDETEPVKSDIINQADIDVQIKQDKVENKEIEEDEEDDDDDDNETQFPDTSFSMSRLISQNDEGLDEKAIKNLNLEDRNDDEDKESRSSKAYVSKKQRRDMKKGKGKDGQAGAGPNPSAKLIEEQVKEKDEEKSSDDEDDEPETEEKKQKDEKESAPVTNKTQPQQKQQPLKRGQKAKLTKMKQKYKDQDEEDKEFFMQHLQPAGKTKTKTESKKQQPNDQKFKKQQPQKVAKEPPKKNVQATVPAAAASGDSEKPVEEKDQEEENPDNEDEEVGKQDEINIINTLTGIPVNEDELLFCIPMCAPYAAVQNFKHKVKMIPGTTKKGQAIKTAVEIFVRDKITTQHEKDLIRALKDQDLSRNLPGKVKVSAPNLMKVKRKK